MVTIEERETSKVVGYTSLFVKFDYKKEYVDFIHTLDGSNFSTKTKMWEVPIVYLSKMLDFFCQFEDIEINVLSDENKFDSIPTAYEIIGNSTETPIWLENFIQKMNNS